MRKENRSPRVKVKIERGQFYVYSHLPYISSFLFTRVNKEEEETGLTYISYDKLNCPGPSRIIISACISFASVSFAPCNPIFEEKKRRKRNTVCILLPQEQLKQVTFLNTARNARRESTASSSVVNISLMIACHHRIRWEKSDVNFSGGRCSACVHSRSLSGVRYPLVFRGKWEVSALTFLFISIERMTLKNTSPALITIFIKQN